MTSVPPSPDTSGHTYKLSPLSGNAFESTDSSKRPCIVFLLASLEAVGRRYNGIDLRFVNNCVVKQGGKTAVRSAGILHCRDPRYARQFSALRDVIAERLTADPASLDSADAVANLVDEFSRAFQPVREKLDLASQLGLWGELQVLRMLPNWARGVDAWSGPSKHVVDFSRNGVEVEVKTSRMHHRHRIRHNQTMPPAAPLVTARALMSLHVTVDPAGGESLRDLVDSIRNAIDNKIQFDIKLNEYGFEEDPAQAYEGRWTLSSAIAIRQEDLPSLAEIPDEISEIEYTLDVSGLSPIPTAKRAALMKKLTV